MSIRTPLAAALFMGTLVVGGSALPAAAGPVCDAYSRVCTTTVATPPSGVDNNVSNTGVDAGTVNGTDVAGTAENSLPVTGGELVLLSTLGLAALAGGTALVVAGRRRNQPGSPA